MWHCGLRGGFYVSEGHDRGSEEKAETMVDNGIARDKAGLIHWG